MAADVLEVLLEGRRIGAITYIGGDRSVFSFDKAYLADPARPTLSLSFKDVHGGLITDHRPTQTRLLPFFSNLLPEGPLRDYLAERAGVKAVREYFLLHALGADLPGGLVVRSADERNAVTDDGEPVDEAEPSRLEPLRFSLAGVQMKFSAVEKATGGLTIPVGGVGGDWIVKLPSTRFAGVADNEFSMMTLARQVGMDIPEVRRLALHEIEGLPAGFERLKEDAFAIRRFDRREDGSRVHMEDFAQVFGVYPQDKYRLASYRAIARVLWIETGADGVAEFIRRLVFNTLIGNADMHLKNWSLLYPDGRSPVLSPGYDFVATTAYLPDEKAALKYARSKRMSDFSRDELSYLAAKAGAPEALVRQTARETVARFCDAWARERAHLPIAAEVAAEVERLLKTVPLASDR